MSCAAGLFRRLETARIVLRIYLPIVSETQENQA
jgi:hypothetical protein